MKKVLNVGIFVLSVFVLLSCGGLKKMAKKYDQVKYVAKPEVLETHGGVVKVEIKGTFPKKYFHKKATIDFQPVLIYEGGKHELKSIKIVGQKVKADNATVIKKKDGGSFTYTDQFNYNPAMLVSELKVAVNATDGKKTVTLGENKLAIGVIATSERVGADEDLELAAHGYEGPKIITKTASLYFNYNESRLDMNNQKLNKMPENINKINELKKFVEQEWEITDVQINSWASPEGELSINTKLSDERGKVGEKWFVDYMNSLDNKKAKAMKVKVDQVKRKYTYKVNSRGEDFDGFMTALQNSNLREKQAIINVIKMQNSKAQREQEIKNMTVIYAEIEAILEPLRRAEISVSCREPKKTDEEISKLAVTDPSKLDEKELLYAATLTDDNEAKLKIYQTATKQFPESWKAYNNAGYMLASMKKIDEAQKMFEKANAIAPNNGQVLYNLGVIAAWKKDGRSAMKYFENAKQNGVTSNYAMGVQKIKTGEYEECLKLMSGKSCKYNLALVQVLTGNYTEAARNLDCIKEKDGDVYYLKAIIGARTGNTSMLYDNLKKAVAEKPSLKIDAKKDREFVKYQETSEFQNAIK